MSHFHQFDFESLPKSVKTQLPKSIADFDYLIYTDASRTALFYVLKLMLFGFCGLLFWQKLSNNFGDPVTDSGWVTPEDKIVYSILLFGVAYALYAMFSRHRLQKN